MGRGRRGGIEQSLKKPKRNYLVPRKGNEIAFHSFDSEKDNSMFLTREVIQTLKKIDPKDVVQLLLPN